MDDQKLIVTIFILVFFWFNSSLKSTVSQPASLTYCPLEFKNITTTSLDSTCEEGTWDGFLRDKCCKEPFNIYLDALALHANQTGKIYLNSTEQTSCLKKIKNNITNVFSCGIEKLNSGINGCSGFSVQDVLRELGDEVAGLSTGCDSLGHSGGDNWNRSCRYCVESWQEIKGIEPGDSDANLCRFAVLTSLMSSKIDDFIWVQNVHKCLGEQGNDLE